MSEQMSLKINTKGWAIYGNSGGNNISLIQANACWSSWTNNQRFAWAECQKIELTGIAAEKKTVFPLAWSVQEMTMPDGYCFGMLAGKTGYDSGGLPNGDGGMPWYCEVHDFWTTRAFTDEELARIAGADVLNYQWGPGMDGWDGASTTTFMDFEQVFAARSRIWGPSSNQLDYQGLYPNARPLPHAEDGQSGTVIDASVRRNFNVKMHDCQWGSGEPIGTIDVYHTRVMISCLDTKAANQIASDDVNWEPTYVQIPPSIQPMLVTIEKPGFLERMTIERRSKGI